MIGDSYNDGLLEYKKAERPCARMLPLISHWSSITVGAHYI